MSTSVSIRIAVVSLSVLLIPAAVQAAVNIGIVAKDKFYVQQGPESADVVVMPYGPFKFEAQVMVDSQSDLSGATVRRVGGATSNLEFDSDEEAYGFYREFGSQVAMDSAYPAGNYVLSYTPSGSGSAISKTLSLTEALPNAPVIENWFDMRHFPAGEDVTVRWNAMTGGAADDLIVVDIENWDTGDTFFETGVHYFGDPNGLDGTARSVVIPSGSLAPDTTYDFFIQFINIESVDEGATVPDVFFASLLGVETELNIRTVTRHPSSVISWGLLSRWTTHRQIGPDTIEPLVGDENAFFYAFIWLDNPDDLTGANFAGRSLVKSSDGDGWIHFESAFDEAELQSNYSNGDYDFNYSFAAGGSHLTTLELTGGALPGVRLANWNELQSASADTVTPIRWMAPENVRGSDAYIVKINDSSGDLIFETDLDLQSGAGLNGTNTSVDVPAGTLTTGQVYDGSISYFRVTDLDRNSQADAYFVAANGVETRFTINTGAVIGDPVKIGAVGREVYYVQTGPDAPVLDFDDDENFTSFAGVLGEGLGGLTNTQVVLPGGAVRNMSFEPGDGWGSETKNDSVGALLADFPAGDYTLRYQVPGSNQVEVIVNLSDVRPGAPQVSNWNETQSVLATEPFTITWLPIENMTEADAIEVFVEDDQDEVFRSGFKLLNGVGLDGDAVAVTIPADTLEADRTYSVTIDALHFTDFDQDTRPGQLFLAANVSSTGLDLVTAGANQPPSITTDALDDAEEGNAYSFDVVGSDPEDGSSVTMHATVIPSWLGFNDQGDGTLRLAGNPTAANVGVFTVTVSVTDSQGLVSSREFSLTVNPDLSDPEGRALDIVGINWLRDQASPFTSQITEVQFGESALISGSVGDGAVSFLNGMFTGPIKLSFYWKVSSEAGKDFFRVSVDDTVEAEISGEQNWREQVIT
ncbi:MAG: hypothetical protein DRP71_10995, partial [Verrucomicrobia bacterium]